MSGIGIVCLKKRDTHVTLDLGAHCIYIVHAPTGCRSKVRSYCMSCAGLQVTGGKYIFYPSPHRMVGVARRDRTTCADDALALAACMCKRNSVEQRLPMILQQTVHQLTNSQGTIQRRAAVIHILFFKIMQRCICTRASSYDEAAPNGNQS